MKKKTWCRLNLVELGNHIDDRGLLILKEAIPYLNALTALDISGNKSTFFFSFDLILFKVKKNLFH